MSISQAKNSRCLQKIQSSKYKSSPKVISLKRKYTNTNRSIVLIDYLVISAYKYMSTNLITKSLKKTKIKYFFFQFLLDFYHTYYRYSFPYFHLQYHYFFLYFHYFYLSFHYFVFLKSFLGEYCFFWSQITYLFMRFL